jgi:hypothetical protein
MLHDLTMKTVTIINRLRKSLWKKNFFPVA